MKILKTIIAGSDEKSDARITVGPGSGSRELIVAKLPHKRFEAPVLATVTRVLDEEDVRNVCITIEDYGALDFVIEARTRAACREAAREEE